MLKERKKQIYKIQHNVTGRMYIGSTKNFEARIAAHLWKLKAGNHPVEDMQEDFNKYGNDYTISIIGEIANNDEKQKEYDEMDKCNSCVRGIGYNYNDTRIATKKRFSEKRNIKEKLKYFVGTLDDSQAEYAYTLLLKLFGGEI